ncbi:MFS transporter [Rhodococcus sp. RS1C4]|uniref:MFS transporter n=1 Tax=Nocardiaceae TaxID=85025 RepID=UPI000522ED1A|nr:MULTISPECIES: MFS transporter [Rhodococcus]OZC54968.1 MFS transporter [Rhodococcus sp. RS1C4]OZD09974.1 MFS transporter [Rhodococcus sp. 06-156-4C]OZD21879.1 MFS transporter [Rhodococcus sp. 06-156-3C]OZD24134.1 MFS transporter [Rhodococcus sp. 06-156-4a]OZD29393.1 MFS transporter [Rhodococcus sp. 06-156-3b]
MTGSDSVRLKTPRGRWIVAATVLGSSLAMLDATVVNVALPDIGRDLGSGVSGLQWTVSAYTLTLASFILLGGALGDRLGRRTVFVWGTIWFAVASVLCGLAPNIEVLVAARLLQGVGAALLTPGSLALISASIHPDDRGAAIGVWSGLGGVASAVGPLLGGWLVDVAGWRSVFLLNIPLAVAVVLVAVKHVPESRDPHAEGKLDLPGAGVVALALGLLTYGFIDASWWVVAAGVLAVGAFVVVELRTSNPLIPPSLFASRVFLAANLVTFAVYAALGGVFFLLILQLQLALDYSPIAAGVATLPITALMLVLSARAGRVAQRIGPRVPMTVGPLVAAAGLLLMLRISPAAAGVEAAGTTGSAAGVRPASTYLVDVLPAVVVFGLGLSILVAPLTGAVLGAVSTDRAGTASGVNNAVARTSQLLAVAALPGLVGIAGADYDRPQTFSDGFHTAMIVCAGLLVVGSLIAAVMVRSPSRKNPTYSCDPSSPALSPREQI